MDISEEEKIQRKIENQRFQERGGFWNPTTENRQKMYLSWLEKQAEQRQKTLELDGVTHSRSMKDMLRHQKKMYEEEAKRIKDLIKDGR